MKRKAEIEIWVCGYDWLYKAGAAFVSVRLAPRFDRSGYYNFVMERPDSNLHEEVEAAIIRKCADLWPHLRGKVK